MMIVDNHNVVASRIAMLLEASGTRLSWSDKEDGRCACAVENDVRLLVGHLAAGHEWILTRSSTPFTSKRAKGDAYRGYRL
jgi:hypothetical protein